MGLPRLVSTVCASLLTSAALARGVLLLTFDDPNYDRWVQYVPLFEKYGARASFFPCGVLDDHALMQMRRLKDAGQTVGLHTQNHADARRAFEGGRGEEYFDKEIAPQLAAYAKIGHVVRSMAYPNNSRNDESDAFIAAHSSIRRFRSGLPMRVNGAKPCLRDENRWYSPVSDLKSLVHFEGIGICEKDQTDIDEIVACIRRISENDEVLTVYSHDISPDAKGVNMKAEWLEVILKTAASLGVKVIGLDDIDELSANDGGRSLERAFSHPPHAAKPHVWYHMMNGNVTKAGITADFEALAKIGIGGVQMFDAGCEIPAGPVDFNSPAWFDMMEHAAKEARRLGLEMCVPNCSGWSSSGGPWVAPSNGMKVVTWRETRTAGPSRFNARLDRDTNDNGFYEDIAVLAFPTPAAERETFPDVKGSVVGDTATLTSARSFVASGISLTLDFPLSWSGDADFSVEASDDGLDFEGVESFSLPLSRSGIPDRSSRFHPFSKPVTARALRVKLVKSSPKATIREVRPEATMAISNLRAKAFEIRQELKLDRTTASADQLVRKESVRDLTKLMSADGTLTWDVPSGDWTIVRVGCKCNGKHNHPASRRGVGLEVDKLSASALNFHFDQYAVVLRRKLGALAGNVETGFNNVLVDSYEVGSQNWTQGFEKEFERQAGYSLLPYLSVLVGRIVGSVDETERFLEDFRRVIADLFARNYADALAKKCHENGLKLSLEPYGNCPADNLQYGASVDVPMGEFWSRAGRGDFCAESGITAIPSSLAHVWGRKVAAAEAFTASPGDGGRWRTTPFSIKAQCDRAYAGGINRMIYHRFVHQPWVSPAYLPGMTMGRWGMHFDRTQTWWDFADEWIRYQSRCQAMLQEGTFVADVLFYCGEHAPNEGNQYGGDKPVNMSLGGGYSADVCSKDALMMLRGEDGRVVAPGGVRYAMLVLPGCTTMGRAVLSKVEELVAAGAKVCGAVRPTRSPGLAGYPHADREIAEKAESVWARGVLFCPPAEGLRRLGLEPDFSAQKDVSFIHRRNSSADWYFVAMPNKEPISFEASFRETGRVPEVWNPETGDIADASEWRQENGRTVVRLSFEPSGSAFVVFRRRTSATRASSPPERICVSRTISGPWHVDFPNGYQPNALAEGASESVVFTNLVDWSVHPSELIRYFSGTATYRMRVALNGDGLKGKRVMLDLGSVRNVAKVAVNGKSYPSLWRPPFRVDITDAVSAQEKSSNPGLDIVVQVANLWANRLIGDDRLYESDCEWKGAKTLAGVKEIGIVRIPQWVKEGGKSPTGRTTFTTWKHWDKDDELMPSGLIGPVRLLTIESE